MNSLQVEGVDMKEIESFLKHSKDGIKMEEKKKEKKKKERKRIRDSSSEV